LFFDHNTVYVSDLACLVSAVTVMLEMCKNYNSNSWYLCFPYVQTTFNDKMWNFINNSNICSLFFIITNVFVSDVTKLSLMLPFVSDVIRGFHPTGQKSEP